MPSQSNCRRQTPHTEDFAVCSKTPKRSKIEKRATKGSFLHYHISPPWTQHTLLILPAMDERKQKALNDFRAKLLQHKEVNNRVRASKWDQRNIKFLKNIFLNCWLTVQLYVFGSSVREEHKKLKKDYDKSEDDLKALQSVGQIIGEVLRQLDEEKCKTTHHGLLKVESSSDCSIFLYPPPKQKTMFFFCD